VVKPADNTLRLELPEELLNEIVRRAAELALKQLQDGATSESPYLTITEAATHMRCKRQRIDDLLSRRRLTRYKDGRRTLVSRAELDAHLKATTGPDADSNSPPHRATVTSPGNRRR
jgi:excisionase family DNA binding protein